MRGRQAAKTEDLLDSGIIKFIQLDRKRVQSFAEYPFDIPAISNLDKLELHPKVTFLVGENGAGKSTLIEAIAVAAGFNPEGGTKNFNFATRRSDSHLSEYLSVARGVKREKDGFFLRVESLFNLATNIEELDRDDGGPPIINSYGGVALHEQSHGESFLAVMGNRFGGDGLYILDEPEAALSPTRQLALLRLMYQLVERKHSQFIIATHSPIIMAYPDATIYKLGNGAMKPIAYEDTEHYLVTRGFLANRESILSQLLEDDYIEDE
jgi:predicted ATPase